MPEIPASHRDLLDSDFATLATIGPDGRPQVSEVWFLTEGEDVALSLNSSRQKTKNLQVTPDDDHAFADKVDAKYGADHRDHDQPGQTRVKVTIRPVRINAVDMRG